MTVDARFPGFGRTATATDEWTFRDFRAVVLENERLRVTVLPGHGAKVWEFTSKRAGRDLLYHHNRFDVRPPVFGLNVDNWWTGGIDEVAPTGHPCTVGGEELPFLGEFWSQAWQYRVEESGPDVARVHLWAEGIITPLRLDRWLELRPGEAVLRGRHRITNVGFEPHDFIWGIHPGFAARPGTRVQAPAASAVFWEGHPALDAEPGLQYAWPSFPIRDGSIIDNSTARPPDPPTWDLHFLTELQAGWLAVTDPESRSGMALAFDPDVFRCVWLWGVYGGWRGIYTVAFEAWTSWPGRLDQAIEAGRHRTLAPGESLETEVSYVAYEGLRSVSGVTRDGHVTGEE
jgi:galactose mutarotase-like enzyme